ncbi:MAG: TatD family hydrolase [Clostridia bacterium]|nr:TatD family hydrolase [Clostridia bacterium]
MTPVPHRGHRNDSSYISYVAEAIAEARGLDAETVSAVTAENAKRLFRIS